MKMRTKGWAPALFGVAIAYATRAAAAEQPLMVVVEAPPGLELDPGQVRRAIGTELHQAAVAPTRALDDDPGRVLIVAVERERITMSLRESQASAVTRAVASPSDPASRLRVIAWLAGNLARDQVGGLIASPANPPEVPVPTETSPAPSLPATETPAPPVPVMPALTPAPFTTPAETVTAHAEVKRTSPAIWTIGVAAGPAFSTYTTGRVLHSIAGEGNFTNAAPDIYRNRGTLWRVEARHQAAGSRMFSALGLEGAAGGDPFQIAAAINEVVGAKAVIGWVRQFGRWSVDYNLGAGIDLTEQRQVSYTINPALPASMEVTTNYESVLRPGLFAAAGAAVTHPLSDVLDAVLTFDVHQSLLDWHDGFYGLTLGLRYRL
ncbi:MAG TPA: hypothetical protein VHO67_09990 [Polyangia bacterium]|nr:hypothetical protein [Polyangia bacterium]